MSMRKLGIVMTFCLILTLVGCQIPKAVIKQVDKAATSAEATKEAQKPEEKVYKVGDTINVNGKYEFTITKVALTDERNEFWDKKYEKVAVVDYTYKNINYDKDLFITDVLNFKVYDEDGNVLETYPGGMTNMPQSIAKGKQCSAQTRYGFNTGSKLELQFYDNMFSSKADAKFSLDVK